MFQKRNATEYCLTQVAQIKNNTPYYNKLDALIKLSLLPQLITDTILLCITCSAVQVLIIKEQS